MTDAKLTTTKEVLKVEGACAGCGSPLAIPHYTLTIAKNTRKRFGEIVGRVRLCPTCFHARLGLMTKGDG